jgi:hypothetical protein
MSARMYYVVTQTREVEVVANNIEDAGLIASAAFEHGQDSEGRVPFGKTPFGVDGNTRTRIRIVDLHVQNNDFRIERM